MHINELWAGKRVSVPTKSASQGWPWEEPYGTIVGSTSAERVSVRLDGECATIIRIHPEDIDQE